MAAARPPQRELVCGALLALVGERGYRRLTVWQIAERAGIEPGDFYRSFGSIEECFAAVWEEADGELAELMQATYRSEEGEWPRRVRATLDALLTYLDSDPDRARLYLTEVQHVSEEMRARREEAQSRLATYIDKGRDGDSAPEFAAEAVAGAIWYRLEARMRREEEGPLRGELPLMAYFAVLPYRGSEIAEAELRRPPPED
jgi:AcrR family transcriptional regulator